ncbi:type II toxin-antitoxin system death-on-curing family toxin [Desulfosporosinus sp. FKA]|uniref:type II toxin-antitoxin system death-on-curing family toxin n=1 Tax=Desulfosporosinus sp. FKA TaxID=1969834 RepID=UPI0032B80676
MESILAQQYPIFGHDKYPSAFHKAAMLMYFFTKGHCFVDGNKRVGIQCAIVFLEVNGYEDNLDDQEGYDKTWEVAESELSELERDSYIESLAVWLSKRFY